MTAADIRSGYTAEKRAIDKQNHYFGYLVVRPLSFPLAAAAVQAGLSATQITLAGLGVMLIGLVAFATPGYPFYGPILGATLINLWYISDFVDGNVARYTKAASKFGAFLDWWVGHLYHTAVPVFVGIAASYVPARLSPEWLGGHAVSLGFALAVIEASRTAISAKARHPEKGGATGGAPDHLERSTPQRLHFLANAAESFKGPLLMVTSLTGMLTIWLVCYVAVAALIWGAVVWRSLRAARKSDHGASAALE